MAALRFKPGPFRSEARLCLPHVIARVSSSCNVPVTSPECPCGGSRIPGAGCPRAPSWQLISPLRSLLLLPQPMFRAATCRLQEILWLPMASPIESKCLSLFSKVPSMPRPHLSLFPNTHSAPAKLICLLSPCPWCRTGHFSHSWRFSPHLCCSVHFCKTPDQNCVFSVGTQTRAAVLDSFWGPGPSEDLLEVIDPCWKSAHTHNISHANSGSLQTLGVLVKNP